MSDKGQVSIWVDLYMDVQRIMKAKNRDDELGNLLRKTRVKLEALGVDVEKLTEG